MGSTSGRPPFIELIGKVRFGGRDGACFMAAAQLLFPRTSIEQRPNPAEYQRILQGLWHGVRCGMSHMGFMQAEHQTSIDVQIVDHGPPIVFAIAHGEPVIEVGAGQFVDAVIDGLLGLLEDLRNDPRLRRDNFLPLWRKRWGTYPP